MSSRRCVLVALSAVLAAGCGGSGGSATSSAPLSKADYVRQADAICTTATASLKALTAPTSPTDLGPYLQKSVGAAMTATDALRRLHAPQADAGDLAAKFTGPLTEQVAAIKAVIPKYEAAAKAPDPKAAVAAVPRPPITKPDTAYVKAYGMAACTDLASGG